MQESGPVLLSKGLIHSHHAVDENENQTCKHDQGNTFKDSRAVE
jgi:hypothetical protein